MSLFYREKDNFLYREYSLIPEGRILNFQTNKASVDIVETHEYGTMFFLDNVLQCSTADEYIYHEFLVHVPMAYADKPSSICILGGGDGCAAREVLKWNEVQTIDLYDWDSDLVDYFRGEGTLWNRGSLRDPKVVYYPTDISTLFQAPLPESKQYDVILVDLLDPDYSDLRESTGFWNQLLYMVSRWRTKGGSIVINAGGVTSWQTECVGMLNELCKTMFPDLSILPYKVFVPSFGREWAFLLIVEPNRDCNEFPHLLRRLNETTFRKSLVWEPDFKIER